MKSNDKVIDVPADESPSYLNKGIAGLTETIHEIKRRKYEAKQLAKKQDYDQQLKRSEWLQTHSDFVTFLDNEPLLINRLKEHHLHLKDSFCNETGRPSPEKLLSMLFPYVDLKKDKLNKDNKGPSCRTFVAEGTETVRLLVRRAVKQKQEWGVNENLISILIKPSTFFELPSKLMLDVEKAFKICDNKLNCSFHIFLASELIMSQIADFHIDRGAIACGHVTPPTEEWLKEYIRARMGFKCNATALRILAFDQIADTSNLGSVIRTAAAFGIDVVVLSEDSCDAWYRRSVRVSMGHIFMIPVVRVQDLSSFLRFIEAEHSIVSYAAMAHESEAQLRLEDISVGDFGCQWCLVVGNEANGISSNVFQACRSSITIGTVSSVDSLSLPIATAVLLHGVKEREKKLHLNKAT